MSWSELWRLHQVVEEERERERWWRLGVNRKAASKVHSIGEAEGWLSVCVERKEKKKDEKKYTKKRQLMHDNQAYSSPLTHFHAPEPHQATRKNHTTTDTLSDQSHLETWRRTLSSARYVLVFLPHLASFMLSPAR